MANRSPHKDEPAQAVIGEGTGTAACGPRGQAGSAQQFYTQAVVTSTQGSVNVPFLATRRELHVANAIEGAVAYLQCDGAIAIYVSTASTTDATVDILGLQ